MISLLSVKNCRSFKIEFIEAAVKICIRNCDGYAVDGKLQHQSDSSSFLKEQIEVKDTIKRRDIIESCV
jgi:hypothetical protein